LGGSRLSGNGLDGSSLAGGSGLGGNWLDGSRLGGGNGFNRNRLGGGNGLNRSSLGGSRLGDRAKLRFRIQPKLQIPACGLARLLPQPVSDRPDFRFLYSD